MRALSFDEGAKALLQFLDGLCQACHGEVVRSLRHLRSDPSPLRLLAALGNRLRPALYLACFPEDEAAALRASGGPRDHSEPICGKKEVKIEVKTCVVCATDLHILEGSYVHDSQ